MERRLVQLMVFMFLGSFSGAADEGTNGTVANANNSTSQIPLVGEYCWDQICPINQFCNELFICQCSDGYENDNGYCVPCAQEYENCEAVNCCRKLTCVNGVCRKVMPSLQFASFAKICLAITATTVTVAVLSLLLKFLLRYSQFERFGRESEFSRVETCQRPINTSTVNQRSSPFNTEQEKPPSYEECMNSSLSRLYSEPPPPYVISANVPETLVRNDRFESSDIHLPITQEVISPLSVRALQPVNARVFQDARIDKKLEQKDNS